MDRITALEAAVAELSRRVAELEARREAEAPPRPAAPAAAAVPASTAAAHEETAAPLAGSLAALFGRTSLLLGGAFLIRALTESGTLARPLGVAAGLGYALAWLILASGARRRPLDATLLGLTGLVVADPLLLEAAARLQVLPARGALLLLAGVTLLAFGVAARRKLEVLAWGAALGALGTSLGLFFETYDLAGTAALLLVAGMAAWGLAERLGWAGPRWPLLVAADLLVAQGALLVARPGGPPEVYAGLTPGSVSALGVALAFASLAGAIAVTLIRKKDAGIFEQVQTFGGLAAGLGAALAVASGPSLAGIGALALGVGGGAYAISFVFVERSRGRGTNFFFFATLAIGMTLWATRVMVSPAAAPGVWAALGLAAAVVGGRFDRVTLRTHAALFLAAAALASGFAAASLAAFASAQTVPFGSGPLGVLAALVLGWAILFGMQRAPDLPAAARLPRFTVALLVLAGAGGLATLALARVVGGTPLSPAALAVSRTVVIAASALLLAEAGRRPAVRELAWLVWPLLAVGGLKLLVEDLRVGRPASLFPAFVVYGAALWVAPRVVKRPLSGSVTAAGAPAGGGRAPS